MQLMIRKQNASSNKKMRNKALELRNKAITSFGVVIDC